MRRRFRAAPAGFAIAVAALLAGCGGGQAASGDSATTAAPSSSAGAISQPFDPCKALTPQILADHQWDARPAAPQNDRVADSTRTGCVYVAKAGYGFVVQTTNNTLAQVKSKFPDAADIAVGARKALRYKAHPAIPGGCEVNVETRTGSLFVATNVPPTSANLMTCDLATQIAEVVAPLLPAGS
ncbi:DUF3558 domain-containing protein [Nocardia arthritidis]|nr:DUF3558 domain-containing protein [Nocardia arthritidis]